MDILSTNIA